jgi:anti-anti-sigma factor
MLEDIYPVQWAGQQAVVALPEHIDLSNADQIREELLSVINRGPTALIADMTTTVSCDHAGADAMVRAYRRADVSGTELRLVVTAKIVRRLLSLSGLDRLVSVYHSREAAMAASRAPAAVLALVGGPARTGTDGQSPQRAARKKRQLQAAGPWNGNGAAITPAVVSKLVDALHDGVALADGNGALTLANARLAEMFGYERSELLGQTVESLIPAGLQAAHGSQRATGGHAPATRPMGAWTRLVGLRKDGATFPVEISISPVTTATGRFVLTVIRDVTDARRLEDLADLAQAAIAAEQASRGEELLDTIISSLFHVGLSLRSAMNLPDDLARQRIAQAAQRLDDTIREIRDTALTAREQGTPGRVSRAAGRAAAGRPAL